MRTRVGALLATITFVVTAAASTPFPAAAAATNPPATTGVDAGNAWAIARIDGKWHISLHLADPAPFRDAPTQLAVAGTLIGAARESADRRTLTLVTDNPAVDARGPVTLWTPDLADASASAAKSLAAPLAAAAAPTGPTLATDPGAAGPYTVTRAEYDFGDEAITLPGLENHTSELRALVYSPAGATGRRPLVIFLHGRHQPCYGDAPSPVPWPCGAGNHPVPSYRGYDASANALASNGDIVVSISADAINAWDFLTVDGGALARAQLVLAHLDLWRRWSTTGGGPFGRSFVGRVNLANVGLMGHSRGGEGVVRAALLNGARKDPYGIRAVVALAPTDFARPTIPGVATTVILPYCDGDVYDLQGQHYYDDTRYTVKGDNALRSTVLIHGANHNFFNSEWTPGLSVAPSFDDWFGDPTAQPCGAAAPQRLNPLEQQAAGRAYIAGWFRMILGRDPSLLPLFDGTGAHVPSAGRAVADTTAIAPTNVRRDLVRFGGPNDAVTTSGSARTNLCAGVPIPFGPEPDTNIPLCTVVDDPGQTPSWTPAFLAPGAPLPAVTKLRWTGTDGRVRVTLLGERRNLQKFSALTLRVAPDPTTTGPVDLAVRLTDDYGHKATAVVSSVSDALERLTGNDFGLPKTIFRSVRIPLASLHGIVLSHVRHVDILTNQVSSGTVFLSDLALSKRSIGTSSAIDAPRLSVNDVTTTEGNSGTKAMRFTLTLSRAATRTVQVHVDAANDFFADNTVVTPLSKTIMIPPGSTTANIDVTIRGNTFDGSDRTFPVVLSIPKEAVLDHSIGTGTVLDDDPTPTLRVGAATAHEGDGVLRLPLTASGGTTDGIFVDAEIIDGTAKLGSDVGPDPTVFGFIEPGLTTGELDVPLIDDNVAEPTKTFSVHVTDVFGANLVGPATVTGTILDDD
jgi:Calx-beta domain-containing protein